MFDNGVLSKRGLIYTLLALICAIWLIAAFSTNIFTFKRTNAVGGFQKGFSDIWYFCTRTRTSSNSDTNIASCFDLTDEEIDCSSSKNHARGMRAFYVMTALLVIAMIIVGLLDHVKRLWIPGLSNAFTGRIILVALALLTFLFALIAWALALAFPRREFCDNDSISDAEDFSHAASPFLMLMLMLTAAVMAVYAFFAPVHADAAVHRTGDSPSEPAYNQQHTTTATTAPGTTTQPTTTTATTTVAPRETV